MTRTIHHIVTLLAALVLLGACSTTSRLAEGEVLYTGVKHVKYHEEAAKIDADVTDQIFTAINVKPNNPLYSPYYRTPFPVGLWVYNHWDQNAGGLKGWLYKQLVARPVTIKRVRPATRVDMVNTLLQNNGYFSSQATYSLDYSKNGKKAKVSYDIVVGKPHTLGSIAVEDSVTPIGHIIDSVARINPYLKRGHRYSLDSLNAARIAMTNVLRDRGYYNYRPEYIEYLADSVTTPGVVNLTVVGSANIPNSALIRYLTHNVTVTVRSNHGDGTPDTLQFPRCTLVKIMPVNIKDELIPSCIRSRKGRPFRVGNMDRTQLYLSRLGIFSSINMQAVTLDSLTQDGDGLIDLVISCTLDKPIEAKFEVQATSKSNSFVGPGLEAGVSHKNLLGGGERLSANVNASYEWQTGNGGDASGNKQDLNSYNFGVDVNFDIPRLLAPKFIDRSRRYVNWTKTWLSSSVMNRPDYFKMAQLATGLTWEWHTNRVSTHAFTPFKLTYSKLISTTEQFDSTMNANRALYLSFRNTFIPAMEYTYTYDRNFGTDAINFTGTVTEAGNVFAGIWEAAGKKHSKKLFGTPFSQYVRLHGQVVWKHSLRGGAQLAGRLQLGVAHAYGNSSEVPYSAQFYVGGANSIRAFTVRTIGPGSYHSTIDGANAYYDQTGTFKFETNWEYRFPLMGYLKGAFFVDAGNVWLLKEDEARPGGKLDMGKFFDQLAVGTGLGVRFDMEMLVIRADLGIGIHSPWDTGKSGYYNMPRFKDSLAFHLAIGYPF